MVAVPVYYFKKARETLRQILLLKKMVAVPVYYFEVVPEREKNVYYKMKRVKRS